MWTWGMGLGLDLSLSNTYNHVDILFFASLISKGQVGRRHYCSRKVSLKGTL